MIKPIYFVLLTGGFIISAPYRSISQTIEMRFGSTTMPDAYTSLRYSHPANTAINLAGNLFCESSRKNNLNYSAYGLAILGQYATTHDQEKWLARLSARPTAEMVYEPWA